MYVWAPIAVLLAAFVGFSIGGFYMGWTYWLEFRHLSTSLSEGAPDYKQQLLHAKGIAIASMLASIAMLALGADICWIIYNHFSLLLELVGK